MNVGTQDVGVSISAAGTTQATATLLINGINWLTTVASGSGVRLNDGTAGVSQTVYNGGANAVNVYPPVSAKINGLSTNGAMILATNTTAHFWYVNSTQVVGILSA